MIERLDHPVPDAALLDHLAIVATTGAGKSYLARSIVERLLANGARVVMIDPAGVWWGLRLDRSGQISSRFKVVIIGGQRADIEIAGDARASGEALARTLGTTSTPAIIDTKLLSVTQRTRFFTAFAETLLAVNAGPLHLVIDEAHLFAPQGGAGGNFEQTALTHATNNLVSLGRSSGLRIIMITQRPAKLHKDSLTQCKAIVAMQMFHHLDRKAVRGWLDGAPDQTAAAEILASLSSLKTGEGWVYAPQQNVLARAAFPKIATFDSMRPLEADETPTLKPLDVGALRATMSTFAPSNEGEKIAPANGAKAIAVPAARPANAAEIRAAEERGEARGLERGTRAGWKAAIDLVLGELTALAKSFPTAPEDHERAREMLSAALRGADTAVKAKPSPQPGPSTPLARPSPVPARQRDTAPSTPAVASGAAGTLSVRHQKVIDAIAWWHFAGFERVPRARVCIVAGYSPKASTFGVNIAELIAKGLVESAPGAIALTEAGRALAHEPEGVSKRDLYRLARGHLKEATGRVFDAIYAAAPNPIRRTDLADAVGLSRTASTLGVYIAEIVGYGLAETSPGAVTAAPWLFAPPAKRGRPR